MRRQTWPECVYLLFCVFGGCGPAGIHAGQSLPAKPENLAAYVENVQRQYVRLSWGELAHECFTDLDLRRFEMAGVVPTVTSAARRSAEFAGIVAALKALPPDEKARWLNEARRHYHPTWAELGRITRDGSGQSWAGQRAEKLIASSIVDVVEEFLMPETRASGRQHMTPSTLVRAARSPLVPVWVFCGRVLRLPCGWAPRLRSFRLRLSLRPNPQ